ncbi:solute carrier family 26 member 6 [Orussus abietinus]|uniref:solute carrier family 26 member 6 n=1 Tax=Orussus abietinus TaxID=222816 RepID=UPI0006259FE6|nr:solute carrier family 26 member 6 [Orussus abietinus]XP_012284300.1 solute carrier family 26 member 6 [Orussus abietinus]
MNIMEKQTDPLWQLRVERPLYEQEVLNQTYHYEKPKTSLSKYIHACFKSEHCWSCILHSVPALNWLRKYKWHEDFVNDVISGITVAIMHIPQGMAYAFLGNLPPVVGIYMAFFPVLVYCLLGTSKHVSMGTFALVCLMTGKVVTAYATPQGKIHDLTNGTNSAIDTNTGEYMEVYTAIQVATAVTLLVGIYQLGMYTFRLGIISTLLSETLVNGFTTAAAIYVLTSQLKDILGLKIPKQRGLFSLIFTVGDIFRELPNTNAAAAITSTVSITILTLNNEVLKPWASKKCSFPIPIELIAVVTGTLISNYCSLQSTYGIQTVGDIPTGLPLPELPSLRLVSVIAIDCISITMVSYTITISMALIFAQKLHYEIDSNQELLAMGTSNIVGSFFSCMPVSASLSRSLIQQTVGGKTQLASIVSCLILLVILMWIGPFFEPLPRCVLASIIVVALKGMFLQAKELIKFWALSKYDATVWLVTVFSVVFLSIDIGLLAGLVTSLGSILIQSIKPYTCLLGHVPNTDLYLDLLRYKGTTELCGMKIVRYCGTLNFANSSYFKSEMFKLVGVVPRKLMKRRLKMAKMSLPLDQQEQEEKESVRCIILDLSGLNFIDPSGVRVLHGVATEFNKIEVPIYIAGCPGPVFECMQKCSLYENYKPELKLFAAVHDAVSFSQHELFSK